MKKLKIVGLFLFVLVAFASCLSKDNDLQLQLKRDKQSRESNQYFKEVIGYWEGGTVSLSIRPNGYWYYNNTTVSSNSRHEYTAKGTTFYMEGKVMYFPKPNTKDQIKIEIVSVNSRNLDVKIDDNVVTYPLTKGEEPQNVENALDDLR